MKTWTCPTCGYKCTLEHSGADNERINHLTGHNPSPAEWSAAYSKIQDGKERAKKTATP